jgi:hypothetical protein
MIICPNMKCGYENPLANEKCSRCGAFLGFPNVNECIQQEELEALEKRYKEKVGFAAGKGHDAKRIEFEEIIKKSMAVINVSLGYLHMFVVGNNTLYSSYQLQTGGEVRDFAPDEFDRERLGVEGTLFGSYGRNIRYAALSIDGRGLKPYGDFTLIVSDTAIEERATLLEENSYRFIKTHKILAGDISRKMPRGYRAVWNDRYKLAIAKLLDKALLTTAENYAKIVLLSTGSRKTDDFIEVHIYGKLNNLSIQAVRGNSESVREQDKDTIERIKDYLTANRQQWIEE